MMDENEITRILSESRSVAEALETLKLNEMFDAQTVDPNLIFVMKMAGVESLKANQALKTYKDRNNVLQDAFDAQSNKVDILQKALAEAGLKSNQLEHDLNAKTAEVETLETKWKDATLRSNQLELDLSAKTAELAQTKEAWEASHLKNHVLQDDLNTKAAELAQTKEAWEAAEDNYHILQDDLNAKAAELAQTKVAWEVSDYQNHILQDDLNAKAAELAQTKVALEASEDDVNTKAAELAQTEKAWEAAEDKLSQIYNKLKDLLASKSSSKAGSTDLDHSPEQAIFEIAEDPLDIAEELPALESPSEEESTVSGHSFDESLPNDPEAVREWKWLVERVGNDKLESVVFKNTYLSKGDLVYAIWLDHEKGRTESSWYWGKVSDIIITPEGEKKFHVHFWDGDEDDVHASDLLRYHECIQLMKDGYLPKDLPPRKLRLPVYR